MDLLGKILHGLNNKKTMIALFIDLSKAFNTLNHEILTKKQDQYGIHGKSKELELKKIELQNDINQLTDWF